MLWNYLFIYKIKHKMDVKHIFVFTICVVFPFFLYSGVLSKSPYKLKPEIWLTVNKTLSPVQTDDEGTILMRVNPVYEQSRETHTFAYSEREIGVSIKMRYGMTMSHALSKYFSNLLQVPVCALNVVNGPISGGKTVQLDSGILTAEEVLQKIIADVKESVNVDIVHPKSP